MARYSPGRNFRGRKGRRQTMGALGSVPEQVRRTRESQIPQLPEIHRAVEKIVQEYRMADQGIVPITRKQAIALGKQALAKAALQLWEMAKEQPNVTKRRFIAHLAEYFARLTGADPVQIEKAIRATTKRKKR